MKSFCSFLFAGAVALLMTACSTAVSPEKASQVDPAKTGLVLVTVAEIGGKDSGTKFTLLSAGGHDGALHGQAINPSKELWLLEVPPGRYRLADWIVMREAPVTGTGAHTGTQEFEFEVRPGEVTYLGRFVVTRRPVMDAYGKPQAFAWARPVLEDHAKETMEAFQQQYPALAAVPVRSVAPQRIDLIPAPDDQVGWSGPHYPHNAKQNESGLEPMPSGPRWP